MLRDQFPAGRARERIIFQEKSVARNAIGEEVVTWQNLVNDTADNALWAEVWPLKGREFFSSQQTQYAADVRFRIRYRAGLTREHRILWNSEPYDIVQILDVGAGHHTTEILAVNGIRNGANT
jgi:SPP1 family predicted phage head-tail adaptor